MTPSIPRAFSLGVALLLLPVLAWAEADANAYLEKMMAGYQQPFSMSFAIDMAMDQSGVKVVVDGTGDMTWSDATHSEMTMAMNMNMPGSNAPMAMKLKTVADGTTIWTEIDNPFMGTQVMKIPVEHAKTMAADHGMGATFGQNPLEQLQAMQSYFDFVVTGVENGLVTLSGTLRGDAPPGFANVGNAVDHMEIVLNETTTELSRMTVGTAEVPLVTLTVSDYQRLKTDDVPATRFQYTPPEGAVMMGAPEHSGSR